MIRTGSPSRVSSLAPSACASLHGGVRKHDDELVSGEPADGARRRRLVGEPARDGAQDGVAGVVAERVVDHLEAVEVDEQHADGHVRGRQQLADRLQHEVAVGEPGRVIVASFEAQQFGGGVPLGDVEQAHDDGERVPRRFRWGGTGSTPTGTCCCRPDASARR